MPLADIPCRICFKVEFNEGDQIITPCMCRGVFACVHRLCLESWLEENNTDYCDICRFKYKVIKKPKGLIEWLRHDEETRWEIIQTVSLLFWCIYLIFLAFLLIVESSGRASNILRGSVFLWAVLVIEACYFIAKETYLHWKSDFLDWKKVNYRMKVLEGLQIKLEPVTPPRNIRRSSGLVKGSPNSNYQEDFAEMS